ncbi:MAG TPA: hypothetical protein VEX18_02955 [Polyangiaceae bacterium]|nr:hypothetical protein [Polyangiaceae bacterium]
MSAPQLSDPGTSSEWFRTVEDQARSDASARRRRFQRLVTYTMVGLSGFAVLGLACFAFRRHALQADLEAPPPSPAVAAIAVPPASPAAPPPAAPSPEPAAASPALTAHAAASKAALSTKSFTASKTGTRKKPAVSSPFLRNVKPTTKTNARR